MPRRKLIDTPIIIGIVVVVALLAATIVVLATKESRSSASGTGGSGASSAQPTTNNTSLDPKQFPLPDGASISYGTDTSTGAGSTTGYSALISVTDGEAAYSWWQEELPKQGFTITDKSSYGSGDSLAATIAFKGRGYGDSKLSILGTTVALDLEGDSSSGS